MRRNIYGRKAPPARDRRPERSVADEGLEATEKHALCVKRHGFGVIALHARILHHAGVDLVALGTRFIGGDADKNRFVRLRS